MNILVVDDEKEIADLVELYLANEGYTSISSTTAGRRWPASGKRRWTWQSWT